jgi:hypothetical protein
VLARRTVSPSASSRGVRLAANLLRTSSPGGSVSVSACGRLVGG